MFHANTGGNTHAGSNVDEYSAWEFKVKHNEQGIHSEFDFRQTVDGADHAGTRNLKQRDTELDHMCMFHSMLKEYQKGTDLNVFLATMFFPQMRDLKGLVETEEFKALTSLCGLSLSAWHTEWCARRETRSSTQL